MERLYQVAPPEDSPGVTSIVLVIGNLVSLDLAEGVLRNEYGTELLRLVEVDDG